MRELVTLKNDALQVVISPTIGASIKAMRYRADDSWVDIMRPASDQALDDGDSGGFASFAMIPYSNRIRDGRLVVDDQEYQLAINFPDGHTIHGDIRERPLQIIEQTETRLRARFDSREASHVNWPFPFVSEISQELNDSTLLTDLCVKNVSSHKAPAGMGIHPYFLRNLTVPGETLLARLPVQGVYPGDTPIPTGTWSRVPQSMDHSQERPLTTGFLDHCFRTCAEPMTLTWVESGVRLTIASDDVFGHVVVYCPVGEDFFAVEPVTNCNNGFNMAAEGIADTGTVYLQPGETLQGTIRLTLTKF